MATISPTSVRKKLDLGLERLHKAGTEPDGLGLALTTIHGALEDYLRLWISTRPGVPAEGREAALDRGTFSWRDLLAHLDQYGRPEPWLQQLRSQIPRFNALRQEVAHGGVYEGTREELVVYAGLVERAIQAEIGTVEQPGAQANLERAAPRRLHDPIALERLREQKLARLDREWRMQRESYMVRNRYGRQVLPTKSMSVVAGIFAVGLAGFWLHAATDMQARSNFASAGGAWSMFPLFGPIAGMVVICFAVYSYKKASAYDRARTRYEEQRAELLGNPDS